MKIKSLSFSNYKAFLHEQKIDVKPITILIGKNSSGKSSIAKLFTLLENSLSREIREPLIFNNNNVVIGGEFRDIVHNRQTSVPVNFSITFEDGAIIKVGVLSPNNDYNLIVSHWAFENSDFQTSLTYSPVDGYKDENAKKVKCQFSGFMPDYILDENDGILLPHEFLDRYRIDVDYIGPFRIVPDRQFQLTGRLEFHKTGVKGEFAYPTLAVSELMKSDLIESVGKWFENNFNGWSIKVDHKNSPFFEVLLQKDNFEVNIVDVGQGINQALPLVVRSFIERPESLIVIEQPELHLHPAAHADLAELFAFSSKKAQQNFIIETHSENFILRLRRLIVDPDCPLTSNDVAIYWIDDSEDGGQEVNLIEINEKGELSDWPKGVFNENVEEIIEIKKALKKKSENDI